MYLYLTLSYKVVVEGTKQAGVNTGVFNNIN